MEVLDFLLDPLRSGIDRRALAELALVGALCGALGFWVVTERLAYGAESLSHGLLPGVVLAALAGAPLVAGAAGGAGGGPPRLAVAPRRRGAPRPRGRRVRRAAPPALGARLRPVGRVRHRPLPLADPRRAPDAARRRGCRRSPGPRRAAGARRARRAARRRARSRAHA